MSLIKKAFSSHSRLRESAGSVSIAGMAGLAVVGMLVLWSIGGIIDNTTHDVSVKAGGQKINLIRDELEAFAQLVAAYPSLCLSRLNVKGKPQPGSPTPVEFTSSNGDVIKVGEEKFAEYAAVSSSSFEVGKSSCKASGECAFEGTIKIQAMDVRDSQPRNVISSTGLIIYTDTGGVPVFCESIHPDGKLACEEMGGTYDSQTIPHCKFKILPDVTCPPDQYMIGLAGDKVVCSGQAAPPPSKIIPLNVDSGIRHITADVSVNICSKTDMSKVSGFTITSNITGSDWIAPPNTAQRVTSFTKGVAFQSALTSNTGVAKVNQSIISYDGQCTVKGHSQYHGKSSNSKKARILLVQMELP